MKSWSIIGAGPVGCMQAVLLATLFPAQEIYVFDKRATQQRNHGLQIHNATIEYINAKLQTATKALRWQGDISPYSKLIQENITRTQAFLTKHFTSTKGGQFLRTRTVNILLQQFAQEIAANNAERLGQGFVKFLMGEEYQVTATQLNNLRHDVANEHPAKAESLLRESSLIFGADGSHSLVRTTIFDEEEPQKEALQYLVEIKLDLKMERDQTIGSSCSQSSSAFFGTMSEHWNHSVGPTLRTGKFHFWSVGHEGTATLHILVKKDIYDTLLSISNTKGKLGMPGNPYTRLRQLPVFNGARELITTAITQTIGLKHISQESIKITTIPMHVYLAKSLIKVANRTLYALVGDAAMGLIFVRGVNNGLQSSAIYASELFQLFRRKSFSEIAQYQFSSQQEWVLYGCEWELNKMFHEKVREIRTEQSLINAAMSTLETTSKLGSVISGLFSSTEGEAQQYIPKQALRALLDGIDEALLQIHAKKDESANSDPGTYKDYNTCLVALDLLINELDEAIYTLETSPAYDKDDEDFLTRMLQATSTLIQTVFNTSDKAKQKDSVLQFKKQMAAITAEANTTGSMIEVVGHSVRTMLGVFSGSATGSSYAFTKHKTNLMQAAQTILEEYNTSLEAASL